VPGPRRDALAALALAIESLTGRLGTPQEIRQFRLYLSLLMDWNRTHRLTGCRTADAIVRQLFLDSLLFAAKLPEGPMRMADIGTGAGIPGIPLRIVRSEISLTLIDSRRKHVSFLAALRRELALADVLVVEGRAETILAERPDLEGAFDVVVMRAVGQRLLPTVARYLRPEGLFLAGGSSAPERQRYDHDMSQLARRETVSFRELKLTRTFLVWQKEA
jgi:16S rRNA (guanine527-N7)-methyltransferase